MSVEEEVEGGISPVLSGGRRVADGEQDVHAAPGDPVLSVSGTKQPAIL